MIRYVIDASVMGPLLLEDESHPFSHILEEALSRRACIVPAHWYFEVSNMVLSAVRRQRIDPAHSRAGLLRIAGLRVAVDEASVVSAIGRTHELAVQHRLTVYDAAYLELAGRLGLVLASTDTDLIAAARRDGVEVIAP